MKKFMELLECDFRSGENKYCLLKSPEGFTSFQIHEDRTADPLSGRSEISEFSDLRMRRESDLESFLLTN